MLGSVKHTYNPSAWELRQEHHNFQAGWATSKAPSQGNKQGSLPFPNLVP